ncbi:MAG: autotransporter-associated beta strand repeat-containing protein [Planctomycetes bacterium]|nr:autotransporter-associated beta strand repeat-containing protein [Planctomycetota bacterium]
MSRCAIAWSCLAAVSSLATAAPLTWSGPASSNATWTIDATNWTGATGTPWDAANGPTNISVFNSASGTATVVDQVSTNGLTFSAANGLVTGGTVALSGTGVLVTVSTGTSTIASTVTGSGFTKQGAGAVVLSASNTFGSGTLSFGAASSANHGYITLANGKGLGNYSTVNLLGDNASVAGINLTGGITANYALRLNGRTDNGTSYQLKNLSGNNTLSGNVTAVNTGGSYLFVSDSGTLTLSGTQNSTVTSSRNFVYSGSGAITITGPILNGGTAGIAVAKNGTGTLTLSGSNSYLGNTSINGGVVSVTNNSGLGGSSVTVGGAGTLNLNSITVTPGTSTFTVNGGSLLGGSFEVARLVGTSSGTISATLSGTGSLTKSGASVLNLTGTTSFTGTTLVSGGTLALGNAVSLQNTGFNTASTGVLRLASGSAATLGGLVGSGSFAPVNYGTISALTLNTQPGSTFTYSGNLANGAAGMSLTKTGSTVASVAAPGVQVLSGTSLYTGATLITGGALQFAKPAALYGGDAAKWTAANLTTGSGGALAINIGGAGEFTAANVATLLALATGTSGFLPGAAIGLDTSNAGGSFTYSSVLADGNGGTNSLGLLKLGSGTLALTAANTYTGATTVAGGSLVFSGAGSLPAASAGWFVSGSGASLDVSTLSTSGYTLGAVGVAAGGTLALGANPVTFGAGSGSTIAGTLTGNGGLTYTGITPLTLSSSNGYAGPIALATGGSVFLQNPYGLGDAAAGTTLADGSQIYLLNTANTAPIPEPITFASGTATLRSGNAASFTLAGSLTLNAAATMNNDGGSTITVAGLVSGTAGIVKNGSGTLVLTNTTAANTFSGGIVQASAGGITIGAAGSQGTGDITFASGGSGNVTFSNVDGTIATKLVGAGGTGGVTKSGTGTTALAGVNTYTGTTTVANGGGALRIDDAAALPAASTVALVKSSTSSGSLILNVAGTNRFDNVFAGFNSSNALSDGGTATIQNIQGSNTLTSNMTIAGGGGNGMNFTSDGGLLTLSGTLSNAVASSTRLVSLGGSGQGVVSGPIVNGTAGGAVTSVIKTGAGTWSLTNTGNSFTGTPAILDGVLDAANLADSGVASSLGAGTTIQLTGQATSGTLRYTGATDQSTNRTLQIDATGGAIDSSGAGSLTFNGGVTVTEPSSFALTFTSGSTVAFNNAGATPGTVVGQRFTSPAVSGTVTITAINGNAYTLSSPAILTGGSTATFVGATDRTLRLVGTNMGANTIAATLADSAGGGRLGITKAGPGTWTLAGANTYSGPTTVAEGSLVIGPSSSLASSGTVSVAPGATLDVTAVPGGLTLASGHALAGGGQLAGAVIANDGSVLSPGSSVGTLTISQNLSLAAGGNYNWQMLDATGTPGSGWDLLAPASLTLSSLAAGTPFNVNLGSLSSASPDVAGNAAHFDAAVPGTWRIITSGGAISGFDPSLFKINTLPTAGASGFTNPLLGGTFSLALSGDSLGIDLLFTPATPYTWYGNGTNPGGSGTWTTAGLTWNDGSGMVAWDSTRNARFDTAGGTVAVGGSVTAGNGLNFVVDGYTITGAGLSLTAANRSTNAVNVAAGATVTFANAITADNGFSKTGAGRMLVVGAITAAGGVSVTTGTFAIGNGGTAGSLTGDATISAGATLVFDRSDAITYSGSMSGDGSVRMQGTGLLTLTGTGCPTGGLLLAAGTVGLGSADALGSTGTISFTGGVLQFSSVNAGDYSSRFSSTSGQAYAIDTNGQTVTLGSGLASPDGSLTKLGDGTLVLAGLNLYAGTTTIQAGAVQLGSGGAGGSVAGPIVTSGTLALNRSDAFTLGNAVSGSGMVRKLAANTVTISSSNSYSGGTSLEQGNLQINASGALGSGTVTITNAGGNTRLLLGSGVTLANPVLVTGAQSPAAGNGVISCTSGTATITGPVILDNAPSTNGGHFNTSAGATLVLAGPITTSGASVDFTQRSGNIIISSTGNTGWGTFGVTGTLHNGATNALCTTATLRLGASGSTTYDLAGYDQTLAAITSSTTVAVIANSSTTSDSTLAIVGGTGTYLGQIADSVFGGTRKVNLVVGAGASLSLTGSNSFKGTTRILDGTLGLGSLNALAGSTLDMNAADVGTLVLTASTCNVGALTGSRGIDVGANTLAVGGNGQSTTYTGVITGAGGLTKSGTGTMLLTATQTYTGPTGVGGGTLQIVSNDQFVTSSTLAFTGSNATFDIGSTTQTFATITTPFGGAYDGMAISGSAGTILLTGPGNFEVGPGGAGNGAATAGHKDALSLANLGTFTFVNPSGTVRVGLKVSSSNSGAPGTSSLTLANVNTITAAAVSIADVSANSDGGGGLLLLGQSNAFNIGAFNQSSGGRSDSAVRFNTGLTNPLLVLRGTDGTGPVGSWTIGQVATYVGARSSFLSTADFSAGTLDAKVTTLTIAQANTSTQTLRTGIQNSVFTMGSGTLDAGSIVVGRITGAAGGSVGTGTYAANGTLTVANASALVRVTSLTLAENTILGTGTTGSFRAVSGTVNLSAGTLQAGSIARGAQTGFADSVSAGITWTGGTISNLDGSNLTIDTVPISLASGTGTLATSGTSTITINAGSPISGAGSLVKAGAGVVVLQSANTFTGATRIAAGSLTLASTAALAGSTLDMNATDTGTLTLSPAGGTFSLGGLQGSRGIDLGTSSLSVGGNGQNTTYSGTLSGAGGLTKDGAGTLVLAGANTISGSTTVRSGVLRLANGAALGTSHVTPVAGGTLAMAPYLQTTVGGLAPNAGGLTDVGSGLMTVAAGLPAADMLTALLTGRGDGSWNGTSGITSSQAVADLAASIPRTVGWLDNGDGSVTFAFAAAGDTNLDWNVDILDAANFLAGGKFDSGMPASWIEGDFGYDGVVDILDAADFLSTGLFDAGAYNPPPGMAGAVAAVPEPATVALAVVGLAAAAVVRRRRW